jgi:electron transport complex protein RnfG
MILTLSLIGTLSGAVLALVNNWAAPLIAQRAREAKEAAIFMVQPGAVSYERAPLENLEVYRVFDEAGAPLGYSMVTSSTGFQSEIKLMIGISADLNTIIAIEILDQKETPGLGTLITEPEFKDQFSGLATLPNVAWVKGVAPDAPNEVQTITGATISSRAVVEIVDKAVAQLRAVQEEMQ